MAVEYQNLSEAGTASATEITIPVPAGFSAGDLLIVFITKDDDVLINEHGDWTTLHRIVSGTGCAIYCAWRIAEVGDTGWTWTGDSEAYYGAILRFTGHDPNVPINISDVAVATNNAPTAPDVLTTRDGCMIFQAFGADDDDVPYTVPGAPFSEKFNDSYTTTGAAGGCWLQSSKGQTGTGVFGMNAAEEWGAVTVAIQQTVAPTPTTLSTGDWLSTAGTSATGNGNITNTGGENCDKRGIVYDTVSRGDPGNTAPADSDYANYEEETDSFGTGVFSRSLTGLTRDATHYYRAYAHNSAGYAYGIETSVVPAKGFGNTARSYLDIQDADDRILGSVFTCSEAGTAENIIMSIFTGGANDKRKCAIYKHSDLSLVGVTEEHVSDNTTGWRTFSFSAPKPVLEATDYILVSWCEQSSPTFPSTTYLDGNGPDPGNQGRYQALNYNGFPDPLVPDAHEDRKYHIGLAYTDIAVTSIPTVTII